MNAQDPQGGAKSGVVSTLAILRLIAGSDRPLGVNAIARELSLAPSSCFKLLKQLQLADFADFDPRTKCYTLGVGAVDLARPVLDPARAFAILRPRLEQVARRQGIAIGFWRAISQTRIVLAGFIDGNSTMRIHMPLGQRLPIYIGAVGRAIAAKSEADEAVLRAEFSKLRWQAPLPFEDYAAQIADARRLGYALDRGNFTTGVTTVAVAIRDVWGTVGYGMSGVTFSGQRDGEGLAQIGAELCDAAAWASSKLVSV